MTQIKKKINEEAICLVLYMGALFGLVGYLTYELIKFRTKGKKQEIQQIVDTKQKLQSVIHFNQIRQK